MLMDLLKSRTFQDKRFPRQNHLNNLYALEGLRSACPLAKSDLSLLCLLLESHCMQTENSDLTGNMLIRILVEYKCQYGLFCLTLAHMC